MRRIFPPGEDDGRDVAWKGDLGLNVIGAWDVRAPGVTALLDGGYADA